MADLTPEQQAAYAADYQARVDLWSKSAARLISQLQTRRAQGLLSDAGYQQAIQVLRDDFPDDPLADPAAQDSAFARIVASVTQTAGDIVKAIPNAAQNLASTGIKSAATVAGVGLVAVIVALFFLVHKE